jgi:hypothetical protein
METTGVLLQIEFTFVRVLYEMHFKIELEQIVPYKIFQVRDENPISVITDIQLKLNQHISEEMFKVRI